MANSESCFPVRIHRVAWYYRLRALPPFLFLVFAFSTLALMYLHSPMLSVLLTAVFVGTFLLAWLAYMAFIALAEARRLRYWIDGTTLRVDQGLITLKRKSIPLDRITDVVLVQNIVMRAVGVWSLQIQTAGSAQQAPEAELLGLVEPEEVRDLIMQFRDEAASA